MKAGATKFLAPVAVLLSAFLAFVFYRTFTLQSNHMVSGTYAGTEVAILTSAAALLFGAIALLYHLVVARRLKSIAAQCEAVASQPADAPPMQIRDCGDDELGAAVTSFNAIVQKMHAARISCEQRLAERTAELRAAEDQLATAKREAKPAMCVPGDSLADVSHEIRTPLTAIMGFIELVDSECPMVCDFCSGQRRVYLNTISRNSQQLLQILDRIAVVPRAPATDPEFSRTNC